MNNWKYFNPHFEIDRVNSLFKTLPWATNRRFAYDYISNVKPELVVELGTHVGGSLFAFLQGIKDNKLDTKIVGVDNWLGDEQAGFYGEEIFSRLNKDLNMLFGDVNKWCLIRKYFKEALVDFNDNSIDLLHIDGLHTYEAVKEDFNSWLPKLAKDGVIFFHDIGENALENKYGSYQFWEEIKQSYQYFEMKHGWGLGILFPKGKERFEYLNSINIKDKLLYYEYLQRYELELIRTNDLKFQLSERINYIQVLENKLNSKNI